MRQLRQILSKDIQYFDTLFAFVDAIQEGVAQYDQFSDVASELCSFSADKRKGLEILDK